MKISLISLLSLLLFISCSSVKENKKTYAGAGIGTAVGAGVGGILGKEKGAIIGGVLGAGIGGYAGSRMDKQAKELEKIAETRRTEMGIVTQLKSDILFETGKSSLKADAKNDLREMAAIMKKYPEDVLMIKGFTDDTGTSRINEKLSDARAEAVKSQLVAAGIPAEVIKTEGLGPAYPVATNDTATGRKQNRRVEIEIKADEEKVPPKKG
ncbi:MAG: OmpA family protein [Bdellovibrionota bacterium]